MCSSSADTDPPGPGQRPLQKVPLHRDCLPSAWRHGAGFPGLLRESEAAGRGECGPGCRSGRRSCGDARRGCVQDERCFFFFFCFSGIIKRSLPRNESLSPGSFHTDEVGRTGGAEVLASWGGYSTQQRPGVSSQQHGEPVNTEGLRGKPSRTSGI